jgi:hypothetical protein
MENRISDQSKEWFCEHIRVTFFTHSFALDEASTWWERATGEPPPKSSMDRRAGRRTDEGPFDGRNLSLSIQPSRVDWILGVDAAQLLEQATFPSIGPLPESLALMQRAVAKWLSDTVPPVFRMAVATAVMLPVADRAEGYRNLQPFLPDLRLDPEHSKEITYQINRPRNSAVISELEVNRLCRWLIAAFMVQTLIVGQTAVSPATQTLACRIEPDVNTDGTRSEPLPHDKLLQLYNELVSLSQELIDKGDIP